MTDTASFETRAESWIRRRLPRRLDGVVVFAVKQLWASLFAASILLAIIISAAFWNDGWAVNRYDALFVFALSMQAVMLLFRLETLEEAKVILLFHLTGTAMEWFKVSAGSWTYPEDAVFMILNVPLFTGFMYASVGSYIARVIRIFDLRFAPYPPFWMTVVLAVSIYVNFFAHHFVVDIRMGLFAATVVLFWRTKVAFNGFAVPLPAAALFASFFLWVAENIGTLTGTWVYAGSAALDWTSPHKIGSWYLLIFVAFVTVTLVIREPLGPKQARATPKTR